MSTYKLKLELQILETYFWNIKLIKIIKTFHKNIADFKYRILRAQSNKHHKLS